MDLMLKIALFIALWTFFGILFGVSFWFLLQTLFSRRMKSMDKQNYRELSRRIESLEKFITDLKLREDDCR